MLSILVLVTGCTTTPLLRPSDRYLFTLEGLEATFGALRESELNPGRTDGRLAFWTLQPLGIWEKANVNVTPQDDLFRLDYVNLYHSKGTTFRTWKEAVSKHFHTRLSVTSLQNHLGDPYNGWRIGCDASHPGIRTAFCWIEPDGRRGERVHPTAALQWKWSRILYVAHSEE